MSADAPHKNEVWVFRENKMNTDIHRVIMDTDVRNIDMLKCYGECVTINAMFDNTTYFTTNSGNNIMMDTSEFVKFYEPETTPIGEHNE